MQLHGQIVEKDRTVDDDGNSVGGIIGVVESTGSVQVSRPDVLVKDMDTGEIVERRPQPKLTAQTIDVAWEDGTRSTLTEHVDSWVVLGSVEAWPKHSDDVNTIAPEAVGDTDAQRAVTADAVSRVAEIAAGWRAGSSARAAAKTPERRLEVVVDETPVAVVSAPEPVADTPEG